MISIIDNNVHASESRDKAMSSHFLSVIAHAKLGFLCKRKKKSKHNIFLCHYVAIMIWQKIFLCISFDRNNFYIFKPAQSSIEFNYIAVGLLDPDAAEMFIKQKEADKLQILVSRTNDVKYFTRLLHPNVKQYTVAKIIMKTHSRHPLFLPV